jgi:transcriptional regulator with XRE-family HTH domain
MEGMIDMSATTVIKDVLEIKHKTQAELAEELNITRQNLSNKMNRDKFSTLELVEIADSLDLDLILKDKDVESHIKEYEEMLRDSGKSEEEAKISAKCIREYQAWSIKHKKEFVIDYPNELKGKPKRNMTEEAKKEAAEKSKRTKEGDTKQHEAEE